jgi:SAM-dependent methyltransferase
VTDIPSVPDEAWFAPLARFLGPAYLRNAFTKGTKQEVDFLVDAMALQPGMRVLDAGCGPGRHALELAGRGISVVGVDQSEDFIALARTAADERDVQGLVSFEVGDVRAVPATNDFDAVICLCQGGFGLLGGGDEEHDVFVGFRGALRAGGRLAVTAFNPYFVVRDIEAGEHFDAATGVHHERATLKDDGGTERDFDLWTTCFTPRELRLLAERAGFSVDAVHGVTPGAYAAADPSVATPEHLLLATATP